MPAPIRLSMVIFLQPDIEKALAFYTKLGLIKIFHLPNRWAELRIGDFKVGLCPTSTPVQTVRSTGVVFEIDDVMAFYERHKTEFTFLAEPKHALHGIMVSIQDPGGNLIDLYQPTPERLKMAVEEGQSCCSDDQAACCKPEKAPAKKGCC